MTSTSTARSRSDHTVETSVALAGFALPNSASVRLHEKLDFEAAGCFR